jgi:hypothetical protein
MIKMSLLAAMIPIAVSVAGEPTVGSQAKSESASQPIRIAPLACNILALSPEIRKRHFDQLGPALLKLKKSTRELADGYEFEFPPDENTCRMLTEWVFQERLCCPFLDIALRLDRDAGPLWLRLTGQPGTKEFIKAEGAAWVKE